MKLYRSVKKYMCFGEKGFSLLELLITLAVFAILLVIITDIIVINLRVATQIKARTKVREETSYLLKNLKKDVRNAESVTPVGTEGILVRVIAPGGGVEDRQWLCEDIGGGIYKVERKIGSDIDFVTPGDVEFRSCSFRVEVREENAVVYIKVSAWTQGMPEDQEVAKEVAVSTRLFTDEE